MDWDAIQLCLHSAFEYCDQAATKSEILILSSTCRDFHSAVHYDSQNYGEGGATCNYT